MSHMKKFNEKKVKELANELNALKDRLSDSTERVQAFRIYREGIKFVLMDCVVPEKELIPQKRFDLGTTPDEADYHLTKFITQVVDDMLKEV